MRATSEQDIELARRGVSRAVYSCIWPETRAMTSTLWGARPHWLLEKSWEGRQDGVEGGLLDAWLSYSRPVLGSWESEYSYRYASAGSTEALREILAQRRSFR